MAATYPPRRMLMNLGKRAVRSQPAEMELACKRENERGRLVVASCTVIALSVGLQANHCRYKQEEQTYSNVGTHLSHNESDGDERRSSSSCAVASVVQEGRHDVKRTPNKFSKESGSCGRDENAAMRSREGQPGISELGSAMLLRRGESGGERGETECKRTKVKRWKR
jgi:hypothetical protein